MLIYHFSKSMYKDKLARQMKLNQIGVILVNQFFNIFYIYINYIMASTSEIKNGLCIKHNNKLMQIKEFQHVKPGKGPAFVRTKMRGIEDGR